MLISIDQAAARTGKSARQIRYQIQSGELKAQKTAGRWLIDSNDLKLSPGQREAVDRKERQLRVAVEEGLGIADDENHKTRYSLNDLKGFQIALPVYREALRLLGETHAAVLALRDVLDQLAVGCHRYDRQQKMLAYAQARDSASLAVCALLLYDSGETSALARILEQELMATLAGLLRRVERGRTR